MGPLLVHASADSPKPRRHTALSPFREARPARRRSSLSSRRLWGAHSSVVANSRDHAVDVTVGTVANQESHARSKQQCDACRQPRVIRLAHRPGDPVVAPGTARLLSAWRSMRPVSGRRTPAFGIASAWRGSPLTVATMLRPRRGTCVWRRLLPVIRAKVGKHWTVRAPLMLCLSKQCCCTSTPTSSRTDSRTAPAMQPSRPRRRGDWLSSKALWRASRNRDSTVPRGLLLAWERGVPRRLWRRRHTPAASGRQPWPGLVRRRRRVGGVTYFSSNKRRSEGSRSRSSRMMFPSVL